MDPNRMFEGPRGRSMINGLLGALGAEPTSVTGPTTMWELGNMELKTGARTTELFQSRVGLGQSIMKNPMSWAMPAANVGFAAVNIVSGYREDGMSGAYDAAIWDVAMNAAVMRSRGVGSGVGAPLIKHSLKGGIGRYAGAAIGASIGQGLGQATGIPFMGTAGAFAGGAAGAMPMRTAGKVLGMAARNPLLAAGVMGAAATVGATAGAVYGGSHLLKLGRQHAHSRRAIHTSGDMAAFHTRGAFTMRQRAVQAMSKSHLNARSALGQESLLMQGGQRNYFSRYR